MTEKEFSAEKIEKAIGYVFRDKRLLLEAFTHSTYANHFDRRSNERLEFLGDAVLEMVISENLYHTEPHLSEGEMTKLRQKYVDKPPLEHIADTLGLTDSLLYYGTATENVGKKAKSSLVESLIAAIYLDGDGVKGDGYQNAREFIEKNIRISDEVNYIGKLQELLQQSGYGLPKYSEAKQTGQDNKPTFSVTVTACEKSATGKGTSKQGARKEAAKKLLNILQEKI